MAFTLSGKHNYFNQFFVFSAIFKYQHKTAYHMAKKSDSANKDEQIGFHKGSLTTLAKEREEMTRILQIVEQLMQMHIKALSDLGVDLQKQAQETKKTSSAKKKEKDKPIEDLLK